MMEPRQACRTVSKRKMAGTSPAIRIEALCLRPSGLLDRGQEPVAAAGAHEGPDLGGLIRPALERTAAFSIDGLVVERVAHRDGGVLGVALAPSLGEVP